MSGRTCSKLRIKHPDTRDAAYPRCTAFIIAHVGSPKVGLGRPSIEVWVTGRPRLVAHECIERVHAGAQFLATMEAADAMLGGEIHWFGATSLG